MLKFLFTLIALQLVAGQTVPLTSGQTMTVNAASGTMTFFSIPIAANQEIDVTSAISGTYAYFYFRANQLPTTSVYDQREYASGNSRAKVFSCTITDSNLVGTMYIGFRPDATVSNAQFTVTIRDQLCITPLSLNATLATTNLGPGELRHYYFDVTTENQNALRFRAQLLQGSTSYNYIYWNKDIRPTTSLYADYWNWVSDLTIELSCLPVGRHYISTRNGETAFKQFGGSFENRLRPCVLPIASGFTQVYDPLPRTWLYYVIDVTDDNFLNINVKEITADNVEIYLQKDRIPTVSDYLGRYTGSENNKFYSLSPCSVSAGKYYIGIWGGSGGQMQLTVNTVAHKCITPMTSTFTENLVIHSGDWLYYTYDVSANRNQEVVFLAQQVAGSTYTYVQLDAQPTESYNFLYNSNSGAKSLPLSPCDIASSNVLYFAVRSWNDQSSVSLTLLTSNTSCPTQLRSHVPYQALSFWSGDSYWTTTTRFSFEVTQGMTPMSIRLTMSSQVSQTMYLALGRIPTTSDYDYYGSSAINVPLAAFAAGTWNVIVRGSVKPFTITAYFDSSTAPIAIPSSSPMRSPSSSPVTNDYCSPYSSCSSCTTTGGCGWCSYSGTCRRGSIDGSDSYCPYGSWNYASCPEEPVTCTASTCGDCFDQTGCVWCVTSTTCLPKTSANSTCLNGHYTAATQCTAPGKVSAAIRFTAFDLLPALVALLLCLCLCY